MLSKVGAYGLRVVLPILPDATQLFQTTLLILAVASIIYGSVMAFTKTDLRLIVAYSSIAQLGFITAGIFSLDSTGANGALLQMVNHGLVIGARLPDRRADPRAHRHRGRIEDGRIGQERPVFAVIFLIVTMSTLAIPGSPNFIGEFYIVNGIFQNFVALAIIATLGMAFSAYYALRMYQRSMHNPLAEGVESREISCVTDSSWCRWWPAWSCSPSAPRSS